MTQKKQWKTFFLLLVLSVTVLIIWACSSAEQQVSTPNTLTPVTAATTNPSVTTAPATPVLVATAMETNAALTTTESVTTENPTVAAATSSETQIFTVDQSQSEARFTLDEELMGSPKTVVGATNLVSGAITINLADLTKTTISPIQIDARGFATDSERRDGAIQRFILGSNRDEYRYIVFTPTTIIGFPDAAGVGDTFELQITGDLTISGVTKAVTFVTQVTVQSETQISGVAQAQVLRSDYNLTIPSVPSVANVTDEVLLEFQFLANA